MIKKAVFCFIILLTCVAFGFTADSVMLFVKKDKPKETKQEIAVVLTQRRSDILEKLNSIPDVIVIPHNKNIIEKTTDWTINNIDKAQGWSLTGWSKMGLDNDYNPWYLKIGIISGRMDYERAMDIATNSPWKQFDDWEKQHSNDVVFGIHFVKTF